MIQAFRMTMGNNKIILSLTHNGLESAVSYQRDSKSGRIDKVCYAPITLTEHGRKVELKIETIQRSLILKCLYYYAAGLNFNNESLIHYLYCHRLLNQ